MIVELKDLINFDGYATGMRSRAGAKVLYTCSCQAQCTVDELFYSNADGQFSLVCKSCTSEVIDTYYCPCTLNSFFSSMAFNAKNRCPQCAACPTCGTTLSATALGSDFILLCEFCKWSSEEISLSADSAAGLFEKVRAHEQDNEAALEFERLLKHYGTNQQRLVEDEDKEMEEAPIQKQEFHDVQAALAKIEKCMDDKQAALNRLPKEAVDNATTAGVHGSTNGCSIAQRLDSTGPAVGPSQLWPRLVPLRTKNGRRAPDGRFVIKPKAGANKTSFDIHNLAMAVLPTTTIGLVSDLKKDQATKILIYFKNPVDVPVKMTFSDVDSALAQIQAEEKQKMQDEDEGVLDDGDEEEGAAGGKLIVLAGAQTASVTLPGEVSLKAFDEIADQNDIFATADAKSDETDSADVGFRKLSKVGVYFEVTPSVDAGNIHFSFIVNLEAELPANSTKTEEDLAFTSCSFQVEVSLGVMQ